MTPGVDRNVTIYAAGLALSPNTWIEQITTDIPFIAIGITAFAAVTCLLLTQRLSFPASCILASAFLAFNGSIFDFARLLQDAKTPDNAGTFAITILREVNFSLSIALNYLFFLSFLGRPPRGELKLVNVADRARARRESPSQWAYWGIFGYILQVALGTSILSVAVLEIVWRVSGNPGSIVYIANGIIQGVLSVAFLGKIFLNTYLSPISPRWKTARDYLPVIIALSARLGITLASEFSIGFTESPLGRLLQAIQLYILIVLVLVSPYYGDRGEVVEKPISKRASSFLCIRRASNTSRWSALGSAPPIVDSNAATDGSVVDIPRRLSPTQRFSSWLKLNNRLVAKKDPQEDRLWNRDQPDLEAPQTPGEKNPDDDQSPVQAKYPDKLPTTTWQGPYINTQNLTEASTTDAQSPFSSAANGTNLTTPISAPPKAATSTSASPIGKFIGQFEVRQSFESGSDSPIYGINGIVQRENKRQNSQRSPRSTYIDNNEFSAIYQLQKEKAELERSMGSLAAFSPSRASFATKTTTNKDVGFGWARNAEFGTLLTSSFMGAPSESFKSDFSLRDFPSPPGSLYPAPSQEPPTPGNTIVSTKENAREKAAAKISDERFGATEIVEDVQFAMVRPRMPAAYQRRRASFPAVVRESGFSAMDRIISTYAESDDDIGGKRVRMSGSNNRLDVTSFIGELTTPPEVSKNFTSKRSYPRNRNSSLDSKLSPLPEDLSPRPSVEIIDMRLKSSIFSSAIAITSGEKSPFVVEAFRKVSFAPVTPGASNGPKPRVIIAPLNALALPLSPLPSGSSIGSPNRNGSFKPATPSPLAKASFSPIGHVPPPVARSKPDHLGYNKGLRPIIRGPFSLAAANESDNKVARRNPPQRF